MKIRTRLGILVFGIVLVVLVCYATQAEPYIEFGIAGFAQYQSAPTTTFAVGVATPPIIGGLVFDAAIVWTTTVYHATALSPLGGRFFGHYGSETTYFEIGCLINAVVGFAPYIEARLEIPVFALWGGP